MGCVGLSKNHVEWHWKVGRTYRTGTQVVQALVVRSYYFFNLYSNVQLMKRDKVTAAIYYYIKIKFQYVKHHSQLSARGDGGVMYGEKTLIDIFAEILIVLIFL